MNVNIFVRRKRKEFHYADNEIFLTDEYLDLNNKYFKNVPIGYAENIVTDEYIDIDNLNKYSSVNEINDNLDGKLITLYDVNRTLTSIHNVLFLFFKYTIAKDKYILLSKFEGSTLDYNISYEPKSFFKPRDKETDLYFDKLNNQFYKNNIQHHSLTIQNTLHSNTLETYSMRIHNMKNVISNDDISKYITVHSTHDYSKRQIITFGKKKRKKWIQLDSGGVTIFSDIDGKDSKNYVVGTDFHPIDICWNGEIFIVVGMNKNNTSKKPIYFSLDCTNWTACTTDIPDYVGNSVCWNGEIFVMVGEDKGTNKPIYYSHDGKEWHSSNTEIMGYIAYSVCWNGEIFVVVGDTTSNNHIYYSTDGKEWHSSNIEMMGYTYRMMGYTYSVSVCWNGNHFLTVGDKYTLISNDGTKWDILTDEYNFTDVVWNGNINIAIGNRFNSSTKILKNEDEEFIIWWSYDCKNWNEFNLISPVFPLDNFTEKKVRCVEWNGEMFMGQLYFKFKFDYNSNLDYVNANIHSINGKDWTIEYEPVLLNEFTHNQHIKVKEPVIFRDSSNHNHYKQYENYTIYFYCHEDIRIRFNALNIHNDDILYITSSDDGITYTENINVTNDDMRMISITKFLKITFISNNYYSSSGWEMFLFPYSHYDLYKPLKLDSSTNNKYIFVDRPIKFLDEGGDFGNYEDKKNYTITFYNTHNLKITVNSFSFEVFSYDPLLLYDYLTIQDSDNGEIYQNIDNNNWLRKSIYNTDIYGMYFPQTTLKASLLSENTDNPVSFPHTFITRRYVKFVFYSDTFNNDIGWDIDISPLHYTTSLISNSLYENQIIFEPSKMIIVGIETLSFQPNGISFISKQAIYNWNSHNNLHLHSNDICWNGYRFVCVGRNLSYDFFPNVNSIQYSDDGYNWLNPTQISKTFTGISICWNGQLFVAVGENTFVEVGENRNEQGPRIVYSHDGVIWKAVTFGGTEYFGNAIHVIWNGEKFLTTIHTSTNVYSVGESFDGINWIYYSDNLPPLGKLCWNGTKYVSIAVMDSNTVIHHSSNGISWKTVPDATIPNFKGNSICWNGEVFVVVGEDTNRQNQHNYPIYYSEDGITWSNATNILNYLFVGKDVCWNGHYFVVVGKLRFDFTTPGQLHLIYWSHNGKNWNVDYTSSDMNADFTSVPSKYELNAICWTGNTVNLSSQGEFNGKVKLNQTSSSPQLSIQSNTDLEFVTDSYDNNTDKSNQIIIDVHY